MIDNETMKLITSVAQGNPGAMIVIRELMWFSKWFQMMCWADEAGLTGSKLWEKYKDEFHQDWHALGEWMQEEMRREANRRNPLDLSIERNGMKILPKW